MKQQKAGVSAGLFREHFASVRTNIGPARANFRKRACSRRFHRILKLGFVMWARRRHIFCAGLVFFRLLLARIFDFFGHDLSPLLGYGNMRETLEVPASTPRFSGTGESR
jgi:hypothetical protein